MKYFFHGNEYKLTEVDGCMSRKIMAYGGNMMAVKVMFSKKCPLSTHSHPHEQTSYVAEGEFEFEVNGTREKVQKGDSLYLPPNSVHGCACISEGGVLIDTFSPIREDFLK